MVAAAPRLQPSILPLRALPEREIVAQAISYPKELVTMRVAVIGIGNVGSTLSEKLESAGHEVVVAASTEESAERAAEDLNCEPAATPAEAAEKAEAVVLAVPADALGEVAQELRGHVSGKPVVDVSNGPMAVQEGRSLAETVQEQLPEARVVKAFNTAFASRMADPTFDGGLSLDGFLAGDDPEAKKVVGRLVGDVGFEPLDIGELKMARVLEGMAWVNISLNMANSWPWRSGWKLLRQEA
ncbi:MAG TPA: NAD(P)-binding domain-containing protein [Candidatus Limnocylindria bacterium]|nr:NAD(P)-binding domain-containing protein [Candidatus Limnocylindria bacterium]